MTDSLPDLPTTSDGIGARWDSETMEWRRRLVSLVMDQVTIHHAVSGRTYSTRRGSRWRGGCNEVIGCSSIGSWAGISTALTSPPTSQHRSAGRLHFLQSTSRSRWIPEGRPLVPRPGRGTLGTTPRLLTPIMPGWPQSSPEKTCDLAGRPGTEVCDEGWNPSRASHVGRRSQIR